jgi:D-beta-D-heptose 7-phosphate kinase/D-beta-D-heptose 1-phosphate adenosyltransferase
MKKVLVIGDSCSDIFRYGKCERLSPEAPVPIFLPTRMTGNGGMAINVYENLKALGVECDLVTNDIRPIKTRYVDEVSNQLLLRVDEKEVIEPIYAEEIEKIEFGNYEAVIVSDYNKGYLSEEDIRYICRNHSRVFIDTKKKLDVWCLGAFMLKLNEKESNENLNFLMTNDDLINIIITKGKNGAELNTCGLVRQYPIELAQEHAVRDLSGAGDTFIAGLVADYVKSDDICSAINYANRCAAWVVTQKGVATVDIKKI